MEKSRFKLPLFLFLVCIFLSGATIGFGFNTSCKEVERNALLKLKHGFKDPMNYLSSWAGEDCCNWIGVACHNHTGNVFRLDLGGISFGSYEYENVFDAGEVNPALLELKCLTYLDLSYVNFNGSAVPKFLGSMTQLQHLSLSGSGFSGEVPQNLGNLTNLVHLDLSYLPGCYSNSLEWASKLQNLQYLDLSLIDLSKAADTLHIALHNQLPSLLSLYLAQCQMENKHQAMRNLSISSSQLQILDLSLNYFSGPMPSFLQNLTSIRSLNLGYNQLSSSVPLWLGNKIDLKELLLGGNRFTGTFPPFIQNLSSIESIDLSSNSFKSSLPTWISSNKLKYLNLGQEYFSQNQNSFYGPFPQFLQNSSFLTHIDLSYNQFSLSIPSWLIEKRELERVIFNNNQFDRVEGGIMNTLGRLCSLSFFDLSNNLVQEEVSGSHANISRCATYDLQSLSLRNNSIRGHLPILHSFSSLQFLDLSHNNLETIPPILGSMSHLETLDLSYNHLGVVNQANLANLSSLEELYIGSNSLLFDISPVWIPPFQLSYLDILPCKFNGPFPKWVLSQTELYELDMSDTGIFGPLPEHIGSATPKLQSLRLANNHINGSIPKSLCNLSLILLDLRNNSLSGIIPDCWENSQALEAVELSSNALSGTIPISLTMIPMLQFLSLNNNLLEGELPELVTRCERLAVLDVGRNNLQGEIPPWRGTNFPSLQILILRENRLKGMIPPQLCSVQTLQIIDLAKNDLIGPILQCFGAFQSMGSVQNTSGVIALPPSSIGSNASDPALVPAVSPDEWSAMEMLKGVEREYTSVLHLLVNMDLSCNNLEGVIPTNLTSLSFLIGLNLSHNHLTGEIPKAIGKMAKLESLDLSRNNLSGSIPESISSLNYLSKMNLSFNNLHGEIPTGHQLQVLDDPVSIYLGNPGLCGDPLPKKCFPNGIIQSPTDMANLKDDEEEDKHEKMWFYMVIVLGFACGFWSVIGTLIVKTRWRHVYFELGEEIGDWLYVRVALAMNRARGGR